MKEADSPDTFNYWLVNSAPGSQCLYYEGFLMRDKELFKREHPGANEYPPLIECGYAALDAYKAGKVRLFQRKVETMHYEYYAQKI